MWFRQVESLLDVARAAREVCRMLEQGLPINLEAPLASYLLNEQEQEMNCLLQEVSIVDSDRGPGQSTSILSESAAATGCVCGDCCRQVAARRSVWI